MRPALASASHTYSRSFRVSPIRFPALDMWGNRLSTISRPAARHQPLLGPKRHGFATEAVRRVATPVVSKDHVLPRLDADARGLHVEWAPGRNSRFHHLWLRDHCRCAECFHPITKQRMLDTFSIPHDIRPDAIHSTPDGLLITWPSQQQHTSIYPWSWLRNNSYDPHSADPFRSNRQKPILWNKNINAVRPTVEFHDIMHNEEAVLDWLRKIHAYGVCFVEGVPADLETTEALSRRITFIRETQYGGLWSFTSDLAHGDTAYTSIALPAHTDTTYFTDPCGLQIFHLLHHSGGTGGETLLVDGFYVASLLKQRYPRSYELLCDISIPCHAAGDEDNFYKPNPLTGYPVISNDHTTGEPMQIRWNNNDRSVMKAIHPDLVEEWYTAIRNWNKLLTDSYSEYWVKLKPGTVVVIDNHRVLHGRAAFTGRRQLCGAYIGKDDFLSKLRVLEEKVAKGVQPEERSVWDMAL